MTLKLIAGPSDEPLTVEEAKVYLRVSHDTEDDLIASLITAARKQAEHELGRVLVSQTWELVMDKFPCAEIKLTPNVISIESVKYIDPLGVEQTLAEDAYVLDSDSTPGWLFPAADTDWPSVYPGSTNTVRVRFLRGYGAASDVPANVLTWIRLHLGASYRNREAFTQGGVADLPGRFFPGLLDPDRVYL